MGWVTIANTEISNLQHVKPPVDVLPVGTQGKIQIKAPMAGILMNTPGAKQVVSRFLTPEGATVTNVYSSGWDDGRIDFHGSPIMVLGFLLAIAAVLGALGIVIGIIKFDANLPTEIKETMQWGSIGLIALAGIVLLIAFWPSKKGGGG